MLCRHKEGVETQFHLFLTSAQDGVGGKRHDPAAPPATKGKVTRCTGMLGGPQGRSGRQGRI